jgi:phage-related protein
MEKIVLQNKLGSITIGGAPPYILNSFDIGAPKSTMLTTKAPGQDGVTLEGNLLEQRTPAITLTIHADGIQDLYDRRRKLFAFLLPKTSGTMLYTNNAGTRVIPYVVDGEPTAKSRTGVGMQILVQLYCPDPYWLSTVETRADMAEWVGDFEFPLIIPEDTGVEMGHRMSTRIVNAYNPGDVPCGIRIEFTALATVTAPSLVNVNTQETMRVKKALSAGDQLIINTATGNETVKMRHTGIETNALNYIDIESDFFQLAPGDNLLRYGADDGIDNLECSVYYTPRYMGA